MAQTPWTISAVAIVAIVSVPLLVDSKANAHEPLGVREEAIGAKQILIRAKLFEVNRTKLRALGFDFTTVEGVWLDDESKSSDGTPSFGYLSKAGSSQVRSAFLDALCQNDLARVLSDPTVAFADGGSVSLSSGSKVDISGHKNSNNESTLEFIGTKIDVDADIVKDTRVRVKLHISCSSLDKETKWWPTAPSVHRREIDANFEVDLGETFVVDGAVGEARIGEHIHNTQLVLFVTPELVGAGRTPESNVARANPAILPSGTLSGISIDPPVPTEPYAPPVRRAAGASAKP
ncbi:hypothetical protein OAS39_08435 [Pirellulales bacterium]|nr:hypothetical protein [Pirellulales bacterium]